MVGKPWQLMVVVMVVVVVVVVGHRKVAVVVEVAAVVGDEWNWVKLGETCGTQGVRQNC